MYYLQYYHRKIND